MLDIETFYEDIQQGNEVNIEQFKVYYCSFENVILWGAGNLGKALGDKLIKLGLNITEYWDLKADEIEKCNGIKVGLPFNTEYDKEKTLIISCIVNGSLGDKWTQNVAYEHGYSHCMLGMILYEGIICPLSKGKALDVKVCTESKACSLCNCRKYTNLLKSIYCTNKEELSFQLVTFIISTKCTLKCIHCGQRMNEYPDDKRMNFEFDNIKRDIDVFMDAVDFVGMISIIGGEPFLHPQLGEIIQHCLTKENFGIVNITTNGVCKIDEEMLKQIKNDRVKISFSIYDKFLSEQQKRLIEQNIEKVKKSGISYALSNPLWVVPGEIQDYQYSSAQMMEYKQNCESIRMCSAIKNGKFLPCTIVENIEGLGLYDVHNDYVDLTDQGDQRQQIIQILNKDYFEACRYCDKRPKPEILAGQQKE